MMIPKIIHYIWLSDNPINENAQRCIDSWKRTAPDFEIKRWKLSDFNNEELPRFVKEAIEKEKWAFACDYLRAYVLYKEGGVYLDSDVFMIKNIDNYLNHSFVSSVEYFVELFDEEERKHVDKNGNADKDMIKGLGLNAAMMASVPNHPYLKNVLDYYQRTNFIKDDGSLKTDILAPHIYALVARDFGFKYFNKEQILNEDMHLYPSEVFAEIFDGITSNSALVHMCAASWRDDDLEIKKEIAKYKNNQIAYLENRDWTRPYLSVVVLCYKVANYLPQCLESIRRQTFKDFEVIMVDDGSPDGCGAICDAYAAMDSKFKVIHKKNGGIIAARKDALNMARGYFAGSVDGDDWVSLDMYEKMCHTAQTNNADLVQIGYRLHYTKHSENSPFKNDHKLLYLDKEKYKEVITDKDHLKNSVIEVSLCRSILKTEKLRELMNDLDNDCGLCEDAVCMYEYAADINNVYVVNENLYHYRMRSNSCTTSIESRDVNKLYKLFNQAKEYLKEKELGYFLTRKLGIYFIRHCVTSFLMNVRGKDKPKELFDTYVNDSRFQDILSLFSKEEIKEYYGDTQYNLIYKENNYEELIKKAIFATDLEEIFK